MGKVTLAQTQRPAKRPGARPPVGAGPDRGHDRAEQRRSGQTSEIARADPAVAMTWRLREKARRADPQLETPVGDRMTDRSQRLPQLDTQPVVHASGRDCRELPQAVHEALI